MKTIAMWSALRRGLAAASLSCAAVVTATASQAAGQPIDALRLSQLRSIGLVELPEPAECDVHVYTRRFGGGSFFGDMEQLGWIREFSTLTGVAQAGLQAAFSDALVSALGREPAGTPALAVRRLPRPSGVRGVFRHAEAALPTAGTDAVLSTFMRVGYVAFKPDSPFKPFVSVRVVLADVASGQLLYDQTLSAGQNPSFGDGIQVAAPWADGGATTLDALRKDPAQAVLAWRAALPLLAERLARELSLPPVPVHVPDAASAAPPAAVAEAPTTPTLGIGGKPLKLHVTADAPLLVRLPAANEPYVLRVAGELAMSADRFDIVTPELTVLDAQRRPVRRLDLTRAAVRNGRIEQALHAGPAYPGEAWLMVTPAREAPLSRWNHISATTQTVYGGIVTFENRRFIDLTGPLPASTAGPVELRADPPVMRLR